MIKEKSGVRIQPSTGSGSHGRKVLEEFAPDAAMAAARQESPDPGLILRVRDLAARADQRDG